MKRLRRPSAVVWAIAVPFAILVGLAIGGTPNTSKDVPLSARKVATTQPTTTTTKPAG